MNTETPRTEQQHWAEAVAECITDEQEALRLVGFYEDGEWQPAMLTLGREHLALKRDLAAARAEVDKLAAFKAFVHEFLDRNGVPTDPPGKMREEGCRVGQRLKYLADERDAARARVTALDAVLRQWRIDFGDSTCFEEDPEARRFRDDTDALLSPSPEPTK